MPARTEEIFALIAEEPRFTGTSGKVQSHLVRLITKANLRLLPLYMTGVSLKSIHLRIERTLPLIREKSEITGFRITTSSTKDEYEEPHRGAYELRRGLS